MSEKLAKMSDEPLWRGKPGTFGCMTAFGSRIVVAIGIPIVLLSFCVLIFLGDIENPDPGEEEFARVLGVVYLAGVIASPIWIIGVIRKMLIATQAEYEITDSHVCIRSKAGKRATRLETIVEVTCIPVVFSRFRKKSGHVRIRRTVGGREMYVTGFLAWESPFTTTLYAVEDAETVAAMIREHSERQRAQNDGEGA